ncbi:MAG: hypothetical protein OEV42_02185 [Deltaproteobacteria bacterium]|nr:hypothetical protein [Deltaproteobacteria bacterium]
MDNKKRITEKTNKVAPWLAGSGIASGTALLSVACTVPKTGICSTCGSCFVALFSLGGWAVMKNKKGDSIYSRDNRSNP